MLKEFHIKNLYLLFCKCAILIVIINIDNIAIQILSRKIIIKSEYNFPYLNSIYSLFDSKISYNTVLIFETFQYHYECSPGFSKYFIELGFDVDIIMHNSGLTSFLYFEPVNKIRFFIYNKLEEIKKYTKYLSLILKNYNYILIETADPHYFLLYKQLNLLNIKHSFFVFHHLEYLISAQIYVKLKNNQIWSLGNFKNSTYVNPHYFGDFSLKKKNRITRFFITSTIERNYQYLIAAVNKLKDENLEFHIIVVGKWGTFTSNNISEKVIENFTFKYNISYSDLYNEVNNSDYIIINLDPNNTKNTAFKKTRVSGSVQLAYGFLKPVIINKDFAEIYNFSSDNSLLYEKWNFIDIMRNAINIKSAQYKKMQKNLKLLSNKIYNNSLYNVKNCLMEF